MTDYGKYLQPSRVPSLVQPAAEDGRRSLTRNSYYNHNAPSINATTGSWINSQHNTPGTPPYLPLPISLPTLDEHFRPLPNPHLQHHRPLYTVNPSESLDNEDEQERMGFASRFAYQKAGPSKLRKTLTASSIHIKDKKRTGLGGLAQSIRRIPNIIFGRGAGKGTTFKGDSEGTLTDNTGITSGNTLPQYVSNPSTPIVAPIPSHPHHYTHHPMATQMPISRPMISPPPEVVRLDDVRRRRPDFRIMPPSVNIARSETAHFFPGPTTYSSDNPTDSSSSAANTAERTTMMLYNHDHRTPTPTPPLSRQVSGNAPPGRLSYVGAEQVVRPQPPPTEVPTSISRIGSPASYLSYVSQPTTLPLHVKRSSSQLRSQLLNQSHQQTTPQRQPSSTPPIIESSEPIESPIIAHPQPTNDYRKMALSPPHSDIATVLTSAPTHHSSSSAITSFQSHDPSFSKPSGFIERFFKTLYHMPWIAYERITVDYLPGRVQAGRVHGHRLSSEIGGGRVKNERGGGGRRSRSRDRDRDREGRRRRKKTGVHHGDGDGRLVSWYKGVSTHSKRTSAELDLSSSDLGSPSSPTTTTSLRAAIGLGLELLPVDAAATALKVGKSGNGARQRRDKEERTSRRHHHHRQDLHTRHRGRQRQRIGSTQIGSPDHVHDNFHHRTPSPLIPAVYPFYYPPYPYPYPYTYNTMPSPPEPFTSQSQPQFPYSPPPPTANDQSERGPDGANQGSPQQQRQQQQQQHNTGVIPPHQGYTAGARAYQPMIAPATTTAPQVYMLHSAGSHGHFELLQTQTQTQMENAT